VADEKQLLKVYLIVTDAFKMLIQR